VACGGLLLALAAFAPATAIEFSDSERQAIAALSIDRLGPPPADPSNRYVDSRAAAAFGATLFFEPRLSGNGRISCATCHHPDRQFQDGRPLGRAAGLTDRRTMPLAGVAHSPWQFWDGRADSLWAQALSPLEDSREQAGNRTALAHFVAARMKDRYERIFGPLPDLAGIAPDAGPRGSPQLVAAWARMPPQARDGIDRVFANLGKALAAFVRSIRHPETRFDRFAKALGQGVEPSGDAALGETEQAGLKLFVGAAGCVACHGGPRLTDDSFHDVGIALPPGLPPDRGRAAGVEKVLADPFNCLGRFSDAAPGQCVALRSVAAGAPPQSEGAFKTPSLRGVATRPPYMHAGQVATLEAVLDRHGGALSQRQKSALVAFLKTLD